MVTKAAIGQSERGACALAPDADGVRARGLGSDLARPAKPRALEIRTRRSVISAFRLDAKDAETDAKACRVLADVRLFRLTIPLADAACPTESARPICKGRWLPPGEAPRDEGKPEVERLVLVFDARALEDVLVTAEQGLGASLMRSGCVPLDVVFRHLVSAARLGLAGQAGGPFLAQLLYAVVLRAVATMRVEQPRSGGLAPWQARRAKDLIKQRLGRGQWLAETAQACGLSTAYFAKAFKVSTGFTPHQWLQCERIAEARRLLLIRTPLSRVAALCGFGDQSHFSKMFKRECGLSPSLWVRLYAEAGRAETAGDR